MSGGDPMAVPPSDMNIIAERVLSARSRASGAEVSVKAAIGAPYWVDVGIEAACPVSIEGLQGRINDIRGIDPLDALRNAVGVLEKLLAGALEDYELYWPDGEPFEAE